MAFVPFTSIVFLLVIIVHACVISKLYADDSLAPLTPSSYVREVEQRNQDFLAMKEQRRNYTILSKESSLYFTPRLEGGLNNQRINDPQLIPYFPTFLPGTTLVNQNYGLRLKQETPIGLEWNLSSSTTLYQFTLPNTAIPIPFLGAVTIPSAATAMVSETSTWSSTQMLSLSLPLWKNAFGERTRAKVNQSKFAALSQAHNEAFHLRNAEAQAENVYWQLVLAQALTRIRADSVKEAEALVAYIEQKKEQHLALDSDVYQARSILNINRIDYEKAKDSENLIAISFNALRSISSPDVPETLVPLSIDLIEEMTPTQRGVRDDLKANEEAVRSHEAENIVSINDILPDLEISGSVGYTGNTPDFDSSYRQSFQDPSRSYSVVVKLSLPLAPFKISKMKRAHKNSTRAARLNLERMKFSHDQHWDELKTRLDENKKLLGLLLENAQLQKEKYENSQQEYERGLTTFFAVISNQNDYQSSRIAVLQTFQTLLDVLLQLGIYKGEGK